MAKYRRQPKAGDLAHKPSKPFAVRPREFVADNFAPPMPQARTENRENTDISQWLHKLRFCAPAHAYGSNTWRKTGGMMGGNAGACAGVTSNNGMGMVPAAFMKG